ncbi:MAG: adenosylcobinamide-GDP ribazoletransferase [Humidesulfovibrio sp.]|uniref:adenosylcobinamide-GDP ribazoletransferase n=1 Tax=Humidesulfovibrio sp. TaxID=2910988 RepID=UPI0027355EDC|nr:adenosylcobinamide-GDP ribazoletransferase [Humidesulfovibrio sp.]MDP2847074.1 adenosylcobinamide-GDP ribazoletransferase [Humidesulfovibrio sp.]
MPPCAFLRFLATLGFLSRLAPARVIDEADMRRSMFHLPLCGLVIGLAACGPVLAGLFAGQPLAQAWLCVMLSAWLTRGLHLDGLADVMDGAGQHLNPERFWVIIKDSRSGTFGVAALVLALLGQTVLLAEALRAHPAWTVWALPWMFVFGRACAVVFGRITRRLIRPGLGGLFLAGATAPAVAWALCLALAPTLALLPVAAGSATLLALLGLIPLYRLARAVNGVNGDFLGASIVIGETAAAAALALSASPALSRLNSIASLFASP